MEHSERVLRFAEALRRDGFDAVLDQYEVSPPRGWPAWSEEQLRPEVSKYVLMICSPTYRDRVQNRLPADEGRGVFWEGQIIRNYLYDAKSNERFIPVLLEGATQDDIPIIIRSHTHYRILRFDRSDHGYDALCRNLTRQPHLTKPDLGGVLDAILDPNEPPPASPPPSSPPPTPTSPPSIPPIARFDLTNLISRDTWTREDTLGYAIYAKAIADPILDGTTQPPLTIGIQAPWGQGKTSLMRMIQQRLDPYAPDRDEELEPLQSIDATIRARYRDLLRWIREWHHTKPSLEGGMLGVGDRQVPTVWFNPLYYRESSQVWAGLAHAILHQLARQLDPIKREEFWLRLQISRMNAAAIRRDIHSYLLLRAVPMGLAVTIAVAFGAGPVIAGASGAVTGALAWFWGKLHTIDRRFDKYVTEPDYQSHLGLLHLVDHDLDLALRLLSGTRPIAVFIDDLDRCDPQTVTQVILAINQFLSLPRRNVFFFLGMDMEMVAAALEQAQRESLALSGVLAQKRSFGWRFMEKFVQLPFVIPRLDTETARSFATTHLSRRQTGLGSLSDAITKDLENAKTATEVGEIAKKALADETLDAAERAKLQEDASTRASELMSDPDSEELKLIVCTAIEDLELVPRTIKRYFGLVRLLRNIQLATGAVESPERDRVLVLRTAHLLMNWPQFVQWLREHPSLLDSTKTWTPTIEVIETIARDAKDHASWCAEVDKLFADKSPSFLRDVSLYRYLTKLASDPPSLRAMVAARMF